jgi:hypothetical protein
MRSPTGDLFIVGEPAAADSASTPPPLNAPIPITEAAEAAPQNGGGVQEPALRRGQWGYFCYVSRTKIDQLYESIVSEVTDEWLDQSTTQRDIRLGAKGDWDRATVVDLFRAGVSYGRKGIIQRELKLKQQYAEKLRKVLLAITKDQPILSLESALEAGTLTSLYYQVTGSFTVRTPVDSYSPADQVISLSAAIGARQLLLDCSLRFFSEGNQPDGTFQVDSLNFRFFKDALPLTLESVFVLLGQSANEIIGSPLFLKLSANSPVAL